MGKLGKNARKFAKKNLQSVERNQRKLKSKFKRKASKGDGHEVEEIEETDVVVTNPSKTVVEEIQDVSLDAVFSDNDETEVLGGDDSDSDGFLEEDSSFADVTGSDDENNIENDNGGSSLSAKNSEMFAELLKKEKKLNKLKEKFPGFSKFLANYDDEDTGLSSDEETGSDDETMNDENAQTRVGKTLASASVDSLCKLVKEQQSLPALTCLINAYRAACHSDSETTSVIGSVLSNGVQTSEKFCTILMFMLHEADNMFRMLLSIPSSSSKKEAVLDLKNKAKWLSLRPLIKSYLRNTVFLLNQITDSEILSFSICRLRASMIFLAAFPSLLHKLVKICVDLWVTGDTSLSSHSFLMIRDIASMCSSKWLDICFVKTYKAFIGRPQSAHTNFLRNSFVELCSLDVQKSSNKAMTCIRRLGDILLKGWQTKKKEVVNKICSWQYINCIDLWVAFISENIHDYDLQPLLYMIAQITNGVALLFPGPRYLPLRVRCIQWLNRLAGSSGIFIPVTSFVLDFLEYNITKDGGKPGKDFEFEPLSTVKLPKHWLKSREFQEECVSSTIELLSEHFSQWSYHVSFPELATAPLVYLKKIVEKTSNESFKRVIKRFIDQVELNVDLVQKKRDDVPFSPKDQQSVETFLQAEKRSGNNSFMQYYKSIMRKAASRKAISKRKKSPGKGKKKRKQHPNGVVDGNPTDSGKKKKTQHPNGVVDGNPTDSVKN
ncbi:putative nucleolar complex protein [Medicago truncatula]|uniref:Noc2p family protein n=1 Tax=Medicago truncatula TaxID=3880 RepID=A0A072UIM4_MEDTR|nr:nucleolar complex protein 2 homolog [Medicago truncatula]KEH25665.1 Noc2p family protein [Medicago truncatula]RHN50865.1 putative nucleolar complex protein [Medicago truncatula]